MSLVSTQHCNRDLANETIEWDLRLKKWHSKCKRLHIFWFVSLLFHHTPAHHRILSVFPHTHVLSVLNPLHLISFVSTAHTCLSLCQHTATHCNTLQHTATHCNTLQHTATHCTTRVYCTHLSVSLSFSICSRSCVQHTETSCLQHTETWSLVLVY